MHKSFLFKIDIESILCIEDKLSVKKHDVSNACTINYIIKIVLSALFI